MKHTFLFIISTLAFFGTSNAQTIINDSAVMGPGYGSQVFYDIKTGQRATAPVNNWDIAHTSVSRDNCIRANHMSGLRVFLYPKGKTNAWNSFDTTGWTAWKPYWNDIHDHNKGAFSLYTNLLNWKFGWGTYDVNSKEVTGDSIYLLAWAGMAPNTYSRFAKFWPIVQKANGDLIFKVANLDGSAERTDTLYQSAATGKMYKYYKFVGNTKPDREPANTNWDITFNRYYELTPNPGTGNLEMYPVMGIESKRGTRTAKIGGRAFNTILGDSNWMVGDNTKKFSNDLTGIGSGWKAFSGTWSLKDTLSYIVERTRTADTSYWLIHMTGFEGSTTGKIKFSKTALRNSLSVNDKTLGSIKVFPNPATEVLFVSISDAKTNTATVSLLDINGKLISQQQASNTDLFSGIAIPVNNLPKGLYLLNVSGGQNSITKKIVID
jgi:hypothetical protein